MDVVRSGMDMIKTGMSVYKLGMGVVLDYGRPSISGSILIH
jgi:hypothetical protein